MMQAAATSEKSAPDAAPAPTAKAKASRKPFLVLGGLVLTGVSAWAVYLALHAGEQQTDDAQVEADVVPLAARVGGAVLRVHVRDDQQVRAGDVILELDTAQLTAQVAKAQAAIETARAQAAEADANVDLVSATASGGLRSARATVTGAHDAVRSASAQVQVAQAGLNRAQAQVQLARAQLTRTRGLFADNVVSQAEMDLAQSNADAAEAALAQARASLTTAAAGRMAASTQIAAAEGHLEQSAPVDAQLTAARARAALQHARVREAEVSLELARLNLSYARVVAPADGVVSRMAVRAGQLVAPGQMIANLVPAQVYVVANFKETQVGQMRPGQRAEIRIDALAGATFRGEVASIAGGTGARFSLLPPDNASGNFVKGVQRVPVRIRFDARPSGARLQAGLSADVIVHVR